MVSICYSLKTGYYYSLKFCTTGCQNKGSGWIPKAGCVLESGGFGLSGRYYFERNAQGLMEITRQLQAFSKNRKRPLLFWKCLETKQGHPLETDGPVLFLRLPVYCSNTHPLNENTPWNVFQGVFAVRTGLEPATPAVTGRYSNQLNYRTVSIKAVQRYGKNRTVQERRKNFRFFLPEPFPVQC